MKYHGVVFAFETLALWLASGFLLHQNVWKVKKSTTSSYFEIPWYSICNWNFGFLALCPRSVHLSLLDVKVLESGSGCTGFANITKLDKTAKFKPHHQPAADQKPFTSSVEERHKNWLGEKFSDRNLYFSVSVGRPSSAWRKYEGQWWKGSWDGGTNPAFLLIIERRKGVLVLEKEKGQQETYLVQLSVLDWFTLVKKYSGHLYWID